MPELRLKLDDLPAEGREFAFSDQQFWVDSWRTFRVQVRAAEPMSAELFVKPEGQGYLIRGRLAGAVSLPCARCAEDALVSLNEEFDLFEEVDASEKEPGDALLQVEGKSVFLDVGALLWEQFALALPVKPLCDEACAGLCPSCGKLLREGPCGCTKDEGDPRLAALRGLKLKK